MTDPAPEVVVSEGLTPDGQHAWTLVYRRWGADHFTRLLVGGREHEAAGGFDIPEVTEIGFAGGLSPGRGDFYLFGLTTGRVHTVRAEANSVEDWSEVSTSQVPGATASDGGPLRAFVIVRPPVDDVTSLVGLDGAGGLVQRIPFV